jgi:hypothetical protein
MKVSFVLSSIWFSLMYFYASAQIRVMTPKSLVSQFTGTHGRIDGSTATFGAPFYGERLLGRLVWGDSRKNQTHCHEDDYDVPKPDAIKPGDFTESRLIHIVMVRRGACSFVTKVKVAREKGAHAVIIVDKETSSLTAQDIRRIIVADDGYGDTVEIPSVLISKADGQPLIEACRSGEQVIVELAWDVPTDHVVILDEWMSSASRDTQRFLKAFSPKRKRLNEYVKFVPHYHVFSMSSTTDYNELCWNRDAEYCAEDPDGSGPVTGKMVLEEDVRQLCIHEITKVSRVDLDDIRKGKQPIEYAEKFWNYLERFAETCKIEDASPDGEQGFGKACSERLMDSVGIDRDKVKQCVRSTGEEKLRHERENIAWSPSALRINGWRYSGTLDPDLVTRAICAGFVKQPDACADLVEPVNPFKVDEKKQDGGGVGLGTFVTALLVVAGITLAALLLYKRSLTRHIHSALREEVMLEVQAQMDTYKQLPS